MHWCQACQIEFLAPARLEAASLTSAGQNAYEVRPTTIDGKPERSSSGRQSSKPMRLPAVKSLKSPVAKILSKKNYRGVIGQNWLALGRVTLRQREGRAEVGPRRLAVTPQFL